MLSWTLEEWLTDLGESVVKKQTEAPGSLAPHEALVYEIWLLDTEARNGGLSQYFCNWGLTQWHSCAAAARSQGLRAFLPFESEVGQIIASESDPYAAIVQGGQVAENLWYTYQEPVVQQLKQLYNGAL